jgi:hypothetical protein
LAFDLGKVDNDGLPDPCRSFEILPDLPPGPHILVVDGRMFGPLKHWLRQTHSFWSWNKIWQTWLQQKSGKRVGNGGKYWGKVDLGTSKSSK